MPRTLWKVPFTGTFSGTADILANSREEAHDSLKDQLDADAATIQGLDDGMGEIDNCTIDSYEPTHDLASITENKEDVPSNNSYYDEEGEDKEDEEEQDEEERQLEEPKPTAA